MRIVRAAFAAIILLALFVPTLGFGTSVAQAAEVNCGYPPLVPTGISSTAVSGGQTVITLTDPTGVTSVMVAQGESGAFSAVSFSVDGQGRIVIDTPGSYYTIKITGVHECGHDVTIVKVVGSPPPTPTPVATSVATDPQTVWPQLRPGDVAAAEAPPNPQAPAVTSRPNQAPLAYTGAEVSGTVAIGALLIGAGGLMLLAANKRNRANRR